MHSKATHGFRPSQSSDRPLYQQVVDHVKLKVAVGDWPPGHEIPSIRGFAAGCGVSVITVKRAYQELEREGVVVSQRGRGSFIAEGASGLDLRLKEENVRQQLADAVEAARSLAWSDRKIRTSLEEAIRSKAGKGRRAAG